LALRLAERPRQARAAFIFGAQRSGTNMLVGALGRNRQIECYNEHDDEAFCNYRLRDDATIQRLVLRSRAKRVVLKPICESQWAQRLLNTYPDARAIWAYRHYTDTVNSALRQFTEHARYLHYMLHDKQTAGWRVENVSEDDMELVREHYERGVSDASARALIWYLRNHLFFQQDLQRDDRVSLARYERIVRSPETELPRLSEFLGVDFQPSQARSIFQTSIRKQEPPAIDPSIAALCDDLSDRLVAARAQAASAHAGTATSILPQAV
jgi:hypothetical protein